ncbi:MAG: GNAT family N-acetyltransferase [Coriobacteriales bacterium]|nr:GNAT family N-acetyltransferase [Coriobacteriales bacterium]
MEYHKTITLKDGRECCLRNGTGQDGLAEREIFILTHEQTDYLASNAGEGAKSVEETAEWLQELSESDDEIEILAFVDGKVVGSAGIGRISKKEKTKHRAEFGISVDQDYWGLGIGKALTEACIECAKRAGYAQLELDVVAENERAIALYQREGFVEFGRNPLGMRSRITGWQEIVLMRLELCTKD